MDEKTELCVPCIVLENQVLKLNTDWLSLHVGVLVENGDPGFGTAEVLPWAHKHIGRVSICTPSA